MAENENTKTPEEMKEEEILKEEAPQEETAPEQTSEEAEETAAEASEEAASEEEASEEEKGSEGFKGFFKKKGDKEKAALKEQVASLEDRVRRQMAEFDNYRKRTDKEKESMFSMGERSVIEKMLPILDNFERGLAALPEEEKGSSFADGMDKILKQFTKQLEDLGVKPIEAVGKEFDPAYHNAVMQVESEEYEEGVVVQEFQKGYMYKDTVLRHSMVTVAK
ncbi:MAG: nucleotide exchange factor GrpE [Lachnospiraceae bacterium]|nr:nucleotide exchange factor GrpE [Lachnospiraceae bacterium]MBQ5361168.1 nucleotide exchange factor GrpE [Lachnospiraceae bacterium]